MAKNFHTKVKLDDGREIDVHVNRRGCEGRWTKADQEALDAIARAAILMTRGKLDAAAARRVGTALEPISEEG